MAPSPIRSPLETGCRPHRLLHGVVALNIDEVVGTRNIYTGQTLQGRHHLKVMPLHCRVYSIAYTIVHHQHCPSVGKAKLCSTNFSSSDETNYHLLFWQGKNKAPRPTPTRRTPLVHQGMAPTRQRPSASSSLDSDKSEGYAYASPEWRTYHSTLTLHHHTIPPSTQRRRDLRTTTL
jgi:hypothetical protein